MYIVFFSWLVLALIRYAYEKFVNKEYMTSLKMALINAILFYGFYLIN